MADQTITDRLAELKLELPPAPAPVAAYVPALVHDGVAQTSGQLPFVSGELLLRGKVGSEIGLDEAVAAAQMATLNALAALSAVVDLNKIERVLKVVGYVASSPDFTEQPKVINGASELLQQIFGARGEHARSAVGVAVLPLDAPVEIELHVAVRQ